MVDNGSNEGRTSGFCHNSSVGEGKTTESLCNGVATSSDVLRHDFSAGCGKAVNFRNSEGRTSDALSRD